MEGRERINVGSLRVNWETGVRARGSDTDDVSPESIDSEGNDGSVEERWDEWECGDTGFIDEILGRQGLLDDNNVCCERRDDEASFLMKTPRCHSMSWAELVVTFSRVIERISLVPAEYILSPVTTTHVAFDSFVRSMIERIDWRRWTNWVSFLLLTEQVVVRKEISLVVCCALLVEDLLLLYMVWCNIEVEMVDGVDS